MKAVLLAAGTATRLRPLTDDVPKCLLPVGGKPILGRALEHLGALGVDETIVVTGYLRERVAAFVGERFAGARVTLVDNPAYATTNNAASLLRAAKAIAGRPFLLLDADIVFARDVAGALLRDARENTLALRPAHDLGEEEMKCEVAPDGRVVAISKQVPVARAAGESIGIERFGAAASARLFEVLRDRIEGRGLANEYYEASFQQMIDEGVPIHAVTVAGLYCAEIDTPDDLARVDAEVRALGRHEARAGTS